MDQGMVPETDGWSVAGRNFRSRLIVGTGKYKDFAETKKAIEVSGGLSGASQWM